eukprot:s2216_g10.t1
MLFRLAGICAFAWLVAAKPKGGKGNGLDGFGELNSIAEQLKDAKEDPEKAKKALNMMDPESLGDSMANMMVMAMDKDKNGVLSQEEIASVPMGDDAGMQGKSEEMFQQMDQDGDGEITRAEAKVYFSKLAPRRPTSDFTVNRGAAPEPSDLVALYDKQVLVLRRLSVICASAEPSLGDDGSPRKSRLSTAGDLVASAAEGPERLKTELKLYRQQLEQVHVLERLDMAALELSAERLRYLISLGYKLGIAEELRSKLQKPGSANLPPAGTETRQDPEESTQVRG